MIIQVETDTTNMVACLGRLKLLVDYSLMCVSLVLIP
jgi:hypothetical protein